MAKTSPQFESRLKAAGAWEDFCDYMQSLIDQGEKEFSARRKATERFAPAATAGKQLMRERRGRSSKEKGEPLPAVDDDIFQGRSASEAEVVRWVADNLLAGDVNPETAPSKTAYALLSDCRQFPQFRIDFWKSMWTKLLSKSQIEGDLDDDDGNWDGKVQSDTISKVLQFRQQAEKTA